MKKFIKYCSFFLLIVFLSAVFVEYVIRQAPNPYKYKYEWMQKNAEKVEVLVLGSSHTFHGISPKCFKGNAFSLANVSQDQKMDFFLLNYWSNRYKNLKTIIVPISYSTLFSHGIEYGIEAYRCGYYKRYMDCNLFPDFHLYNYELYNTNTIFRKMGKVILKRNNPGCDEYGWGKICGSLSEKNIRQLYAEAESAAKRHTAKDWDCVNDNYSRLSKIALFCRQQNVKLILITTPCWHLYTDKLNKKQLSKMYDLIHRFQRENNIVYFDYLKDSRFGPNDFYDCDHLSEIGSVKFSKILATDISKNEMGK